MLYDIALVMSGIMFAKVIIIFLLSKFSCVFLLPSLIFCERKENLIKKFETSYLSILLFFETLIVVCTILISHCFLHVFHCSFSLYQPM